jgi:alpha-galactosidase
LKSKKSKNTRTIYKDLPSHLEESCMVTEKEIDTVKRWVESITSDNEDNVKSGMWIDNWLYKAIPFSFLYGGIHSAVLIKDFIKKNANIVEEDYMVNYGCSYIDTKTGFSIGVEIKRYKDFSAVEININLENTGERDTLIIDEFKSLDIKIRNNNIGSPYFIHGANGGRSLPDDFLPFSYELPSVGMQKRPIVLGGTTETLRSSEKHLPFFTLESSDRRGIIIGIGWSGTWISHIGVNGTNLRCKTGIDNSSYLLHPGEKIIMPRILLLLWEGERLHGQNMFRRLLYEKYVPGTDDKIQKPMVTVNHGFTHHYWSRKREQIGDYEHYLFPREENIMPLIEPFGEIGVELMNIDIGWTKVYKSGIGVGDWRYDSLKFPHGLKNISDKMNDKNIKFGIWFQSEKVDSNAPLVSEHPEWLGYHKEPCRYTLRMDIPEVREWFLGQIDYLIKYQGMQCYRQDGWGAFEPDEPDYRKGISQIKHLNGLYELWDEIRERYPHIIMEGCSGGGRRIDMETISRFSWHQKADYFFDPESDQCGLYGANMFLPGGLLIIPVEGMDDYSVWSGFAGQLNLGWHPLDNGFPMDLAKRQVDLYKNIRHLLSGDFYPLTPCSLDNDWIGYQFHRNDLDEGFALLFRRYESNRKPYPCPNIFIAHIRGVEKDKKYITYFEKRGVSEVFTGGQLSKGINIKIDEVPGVELIRYSRSESY